MKNGNLKQKISFVTTGQFFYLVTYFHDFLVSLMGHLFVDFFRVCDISLNQRPDQYKMKILVFSIQYDFQILKYQYQYSI